MIPERDPTTTAKINNIKTNQVSGGAVGHTVWLHVKGHEVKAGWHVCGSHI